MQINGRRIAIRERRAFTLIELLVVMTVMAVLSATAIPSFRRTLERSRADYAAANLDAIWKAQQLFWLESRTYASSIDQLVSAGMIDSTMLGNQGDYTYSIPFASNQTFSARAIRRGSRQWSGAFAIDETGLLSGSIKGTGVSSILPPLEL